MKFFKKTLKDYYWKLNSNSQIYKYCLGIVLAISIWYVQRNREVYFSSFTFSMADGYVISINRWMNILIVFPITFFTTIKILESIYSIQHVLLMHSLRKMWIKQLIQYALNAIVLAVILTFIIGIANLDVISNFINFSEMDSIFAFYCKVGISKTITLWHVIWAFASCEAIIILSGSVLIAFLNIFFKVREAIIISGFILVGEMFFGLNVLGVSDINISYARWYPNVNFHLQHAIFVIIIEIVSGLFLIKMKDVFYGEAEIF